MSSLRTALAVGAFSAAIHIASAQTTECVSVDATGRVGDRGSQDASISADGQVVAFVSYATNLVAGDVNAELDVFVHEPSAGDATWSNYGSDFPGTHGVPSFTSRQNPVLGSTITLDLVNSYANPTVGLLFVGFQRTSIHSSWGGDLLVVPALTLSVTLASGVESFTGAIPIDASLCGFSVDLQAIESGPGAAKGVSFTAGLELLLGR